MSLEDHRFAVQRFDRAAWIAATRANLVADSRFGHRDVVDDFLARCDIPELAELRGWLHDADAAALERRAEELRPASLLFLVLMLGGACNADCEICFTDRRRKPHELDQDARAAVLRQARSLGARYVYVPGEGEPTIDSGFWPMLEVCREVGLHAIVFTNGLVLSDEAACLRYWGTRPDEAVAALAEYPVSLYVKTWTTRPALIRQMMRIEPEPYGFAAWRGTVVSAALRRLLDAFPRDRVGIEVVVERRNADEVVDAIVPFANEHRLSRIVEMPQHNGRLFGDGRFDPTPEQARRIQPHLSVTSCSMATCKAVVTSQGYLSPRIAILESQIPRPLANVREQDLYEALHHTLPLVNLRYEIFQCLCERLPVEFAGARRRLACAANVLPSGLRPAVREVKHP